MEDMARLALVEQNVQDAETFSKILYELLTHITHILDNPHDYELRIIRSEVLKTVLKYEAFVDYLKSIGFQPIGDNYTYPKEQTLSKLRMAQAAIERKIYFCCGSLNHCEGRVKSGVTIPLARKQKLMPVKVLTTTNPFLLKLQTLFNGVLDYENDELQALARDQIPIMTLQLMALDSCREHQRKLKAGEMDGQDLPFDKALLLELLGWFKYKFFSWVDQPPCETCGGPTKHYRNSNIVTDSEICRVEHYKCTRCADGAAEFPRYNDVRTLLRTRRGRCGEWANCFTLLCRALGYDTRYVYDTTDHVWCEVYDYDSNAWLHVDPCEGKLDAPLLYSHGWGKKLAYVIAFSRDDLQDVTWRYTTQHTEVLKRRTLCTEQELTSTILLLREARQRQISEPRRRCLAKRCLEELVQLMVEKKPEDGETQGRISGSTAWRRERGEIGTQGHVFRFVCPGPCSVQYCTASDKYTVTGGAESELSGWASGVYSAKSVFRKVEHDWRMVYLAREEGSGEGSVSWRVEACPGGVLHGVRARLHATLYEDATVACTVSVDDAPHKPCQFSDAWMQVAAQCRSATLTASLRGGRGELAWQHAQLLRQPLDDARSMFDIAATLELL
ncbi:peptide-N(4)-(N-acetyl-beta-glucosaminyl)asparagine amidase [Hyposmocoma kahamanoa]|uniref:peptide-N(4)-(N-acetyl-beta- glucosaminyl)asparagine amidase n=1 Tax=Hyposmocoma kahamanoa TaxID=1477025 RepID=UPI000E6D6567|nr:peptide-N(4)-(N-acetyl-beta-glucosaminyl)asparagine amidase [Hyposmocoma kahamanoa]